MAEDRVDLDPQQVSNGLAKWDQVAETLQTRWDGVHGQITGLLTPATFGADEPGSNFQASFVAEGQAGTFHERGMETVTAVEETGQDVRKAAEASLDADSRQASEVGGVQPAAFNAGTGGGGGGGSSSGGGGGGGGGGAMMSGGSGSSGMMMSGKVGEDMWMSGTSEGAITGEAQLISGPSQALWTPEDRERGYVDTMGEMQFESGSAMRGDAEAMYVSDGPGQAQYLPDDSQIVYERQPMPAGSDQAAPGQAVPGQAVPGQAAPNQFGVAGESMEAIAPAGDRMSGPTPDFDGQVEGQTSGPAAQGGSGQSSPEGATADRSAEAEPAPQAAEDRGETIRERIADRIPDRIVEQLPDGIAERIYEARGDYTIEGPELPGTS